MKKHGRFAVRLLITAAAVALVWAGLNRTLTAKNFADGSWPETTTALEFYALEENSVDVLFLGSSHAVTAFLPQALYNDYGITSYNLGTEQQSMVVSYYWLQEALRTQQPEVVVLDTYMLFSFNASEPLNCSESAVRLAMDFMKTGPVKLQAVQDICRIDPSQSELSYFLTSVRYHTRWKDLDDSDFLFSEYASISGLMGYGTASNGTVSDAFRPFDAAPAEPAGTAEMLPLMQTYLEKIVDLCAQEGIELILTKTPSTAETVEKYNTLSAFAGEHGLAFYDFNTGDLYEQTGFDFAADMADNGHLGLSGAQKITDYLGSLLQTEYGLQSHTAADWEAGRAVYADFLAEEALGRTESLSDWLAALQEQAGGCTILLAAQGEAFSGLTQDDRAVLAAMGLSVPDGSGESYYAVLENGTVRAEAAAAEKLEKSGSFRNGQVPYTISSAGTQAGGSCSIVVDGVEYAGGQTGLHFVVYDSARHRVVDSVCFDPGGERTAIR